MPCTQSAAATNALTVSCPCPRARARCACRHHDSRPTLQQYTHAGYRIAMLLSMRGRIHPCSRPVWHSVCRCRLTAPPPHNMQLPELRAPQQHPPVASKRVHMAPPAGGLGRHACALPPNPRLCRAWAARLVHHFFGPPAAAAPPARLPPPDAAGLPVLLLRGELASRAGLPRQRSRRGVPGKPAGGESARGRR